MTINMLCSECGSALIIKDELAGAIRHCPKCKVELHIPALAGAIPPSDAELDELAEPSGDARNSAPLSSTAIGGSGASPGSSFPDDEPPHLIDAFESNGKDDTSELPATGDTREIAAPEIAASVRPPEPEPRPTAHSRKSSSSAPRAAHDDEEFDPAAFLSESSPVQSAPRTPSPAPPVERDVRPRAAVESSRRAGPERQAATADNPPRPSAVSGASAAADLWDHAKAVKQLRKAMKEGSAELQLQKQESRKPAVDWAGMVREVGLKGVGILAIGLLAAVGGYYGFDRLMADGLKLPKLGYVEGNVTLDGQPVVGATVYFSPLEAELGTGGRDRIRTSTAQTDAQGHFKMLYIDRTAGVAVGRSRVWISGVGAPQPVHVPPDFGEGSMLLKDVKEGTQTIDIAMTSGPAKTAAARR